MYDESEERDEIPDVRLSLDLKKPITGTKIIEVLKQYAGQQQDLIYEERKSPVSDGFYMAGVSSEDPARHVILCSGDNLEHRQIKPEETYSKLGIGSYEWPDSEVYAIIASEEGITKAVAEIKEGIEKLLD